MSQKFGKDVKKLFNACVDLPKHEQEPFIDSSHFSNEVKNQVSKLLNYSGDIDSELSQVILDTAKQGLNLSSIHVGDQIDQYRLIEPIGEGGQGEVWLAQRADGEFNHKVAIKFLKLSPNEKEQQRFQTERELLASLQHTNIASLIGGGQYKDRLYMIMQWIDGILLTDYLKQHNSDLKETLNCFLQICYAVSYAHSKGIIHRDIKPSNILIDKNGIIKLLDFGIAKTIDAQVTQNQSAVMMTLAYSSPEQINGNSVSTATDVYALGLILYELLTSQRAQDNTTQTHADFIRLITDITPTKPSELESKELLKFTAKTLQGDLDNMVMMAIRKEPTRRYGNADALITDVKNYLQSRPLYASGDSFTYKMAKLLKRNPLASFLTTMILAFLVILPVIMYQNGIQLKQERDKANEHVLIADKTTEFLTTLFESASPLGHKGNSIDLKSVLEQGERQLSEGLSTQPKVTAALSMIMAQIQHHMENTEKAIEYYNKGANLYKKIGDKEGELEALGQLAVMSFRNDDIENTEAYFTRADDVAKDVKNNVILAWHKIRKTTVANERGKKDEAITLVEDAMTKLDSKQNKDIVLLGRLYSELGEAYKFKDPEKSLALNEKALKFAEQDVGKIHPFYLGRLSSKAIRLMRLNRHKEAEKIIDETIKIALKLYSENHPKFATFLTSKATFLHDTGHFKEVELLYHKTLNIYRENYGENNYDYARVINNLAYLYEDMGEFMQAKKLYSQSIELRTKLDPDNLIRIATAKANLARLLTKMGQYRQSAELLKPIIPIFELNNRNNLYNKITQMANEFGNGSNTQKCEDGTKTLNKLIPFIQKQSPKSWKRMGAELWIGQILYSCEFNQQAKKWFNSALEMSKNVYQPDSEGYKIILKQTKLH